MSTTKLFPLGEVMALLTNAYLYTPSVHMPSQDDDLIYHMTKGQQTFKVSLTAYAAITKSLHAQFPWIKDLNVPRHTRQGSAYVWSWLDKQEQRWGSHLAVKPLTSEEWSPRAEPSVLTRDTTWFTSEEALAILLNLMGLPNDSE